MPFSSSWTSASSLLHLCFDHFFYRYVDFLWTRFLHQSTFFSLGLAFCCTSFGLGFCFCFNWQFGRPHKTQEHRQIGFIRPSRCLSHRDHVEFWAFRLADYSASHLDLLPVDAVGSVLRYVIRCWRNLFGYPPWGDSAVPGESCPTDAQRSDSRVHGPIVGCGSQNEGEHRSAY